MSRSHIVVIEELVHPDPTMARNARIPKITLSDTQLDDLAQMMNELVDARIGAGATLAEQSAATQALTEELLRR
ncbi:hypothetical protein [Enhygromyxa salina]|nr:hypothetical protein [Enhygromyxa salina]